MIRIFVSFLILSGFSFGWFGSCVNKSCNPSLEYAMGKERRVISKRLGELIKSVASMTKETEEGSKLILKEIIELNRLRQRSVISLQSSFRESFTTKRIRAESSFGVDLRNIMHKPKTKQEGE